MEMEKLEEIFTENEMINLYERLYGQSINADVPAKLYLISPWLDKTLNNKIINLNSEQACCLLEKVCDFLDIEIKKDDGRRISINELDLGKEIKKRNFRLDYCMLFNKIEFYNFITINIKKTYIIIMKDSFKYSVNVIPCDISEKPSNFEYDENCLKVAFEEIYKLPNINDIKLYSNDCFYYQKLYEKIIDEFFNKNIEEQEEN